MPLTRDDVQGVYAGLRPLLAGESDATSKLSREHTVAHPVPGLVVDRGRQVHDVPGDGQGRRGRGRARTRPPGRRLLTEEVPAGRRRGLSRAVERPGPHRRPHRAARARVEHLLNRYGSMAEEVLDLIAADPKLGEPLPAADDYLKAEIVYACTHEGARHLDDVLTRRTRISIETFDRGTRSARECAELMAPRPGLGHGPDRARGRALREAGRGGAGVAVPARRPDGGRGPAGRAGHRTAVIRRGADGPTGPGLPQGLLAV